MLKWTAVGTVLLVGIVLLPAGARGVGCPGPESTLERDLYTFGNMHGSLDFHDIDRYMQYPLPWLSDLCYIEFEDDTYDAKDRYVAVGSAIERQNCSEGYDDAKVINTTSVAVTVSLGGSYSSQIGANLGWGSAGTLSFGSASAFNWSVSGTYTGSFTLETPGCAPNTHRFWWPYVRYADRKGGRYAYVMGTVWNWCVTHSQWGLGYTNQVDYYGHDEATTTYVAGNGESYNQCTPCSCSLSYQGCVYPVTCPAPYTYQQVWNFYWLY